MNNIANFFWGLVIVFGAVGCSQKASQDAVQNTSQSNAQDAESVSTQIETHENYSPKLARQLPQFAEPRLDYSGSTGYVKPGAAITVEHDYDGETDPGVREFFNLHVKPASTSGNMTLELSTSEGLDLLVDSTLHLEMSGQAIVVPVEVFADEAGQYRLNVVASVGEESLRRSMRASSITISVGAGDLVFKKPSLGTDGEAIVTFEAEETIY